MACWWWLHLPQAFPDRRGSMGWVVADGIRVCALSARVMRHDPNLCFLSNIRSISPYGFSEANAIVPQHSECHVISSSDGIRRI